MKYCNAGGTQAWIRDASRSEGARNMSIQRKRERAAKQMVAEIAEFALFADESMFGMPDIADLVPATDDGPEIRDAR